MYALPLEVSSPSGSRVSRRDNPCRKNENVPFLTLANVTFLAFANVKRASNALLKPYIVIYINPFQFNAVSRRTFISPRRVRSHKGLPWKVAKVDNFSPLGGHINKYNFDTSLQNFRFSSSKPLTGCKVICTKGKSVHLPHITAVCRTVRAKPGQRWKNVQTFE